MDIGFASETSLMAKRRIEAGYKKLRNQRVLQLASMVVKSTPVDRGEARAGWTVGMTEADTPTGDLDPNGDATIAKISAKLDTIHHFANVVLSNPVPHMEYLEGGSSTQAPMGVVKVNLSAFKSMHGDVK